MGKNKYNIQVVTFFKKMKIQMMTSTILQNKFCKGIKIHNNLQKIQKDAQKAK